MNCKLSVVLALYSIMWTMGLDVFDHSDELFYFVLAFFLLVLFIGIDVPIFFFFHLFGQYNVHD